MSAILPAAAGPAPTEAGSRGHLLSIRTFINSARNSAGALTLVLLPWWWHWIIIRRPFEGILFHELTDFSLYATDALLLCALAAWLVTKPDLSALPRWVLWPLLALPLLAFALVTAAADRDLALYQAARLSLVTLWSLALAGSPWLRRAAPALLLVGSSLQAIIALAQVALQHAVGLGFVGEVPLSQQMPGVSVVYAAGVRWLRPYGLTQHPNILAGCLSVAFLLALATVTTGNVRQRWAWYVGLVLTGAGLAVAFSRATWIGTALGGLFIGSHILSSRSPAVRRRLVRRVLLLLVSAGLVFGALTWPILASRLGLTGASAEARSINERGATIAIAWRHLITAPWPGIGLAQFTRLTLAGNLDLLGPYAPQPVHVTPLLVLVELGPIGGLLWLWLMLAPPIRWIRRPTHAASLLGPTAALLALVVIGLFDYYPFQATQGRLLTWTVLGLWGAAWAAAARETTPITPT
jgi:O-antigen ligase